jgi:hypothetical protein
MFLKFHHHDYLVAHDGRDLDIFSVHNLISPKIIELFFNRGEV